MMVVVISDFLRPFLGGYNKPFLFIWSITDFCLIPEGMLHKGSLVARCLSSFVWLADGAASGSLSKQVLVQHRGLTSSKKWVFVLWVSLYFQHVLDI